MYRHLLGMLIFNDDLRNISRSLTRALWANVVAVRYALVPCLVMAIPVSVVLVQVEQWYGHPGLRPHEAAHITVHFSQLPERVDMEVVEGVASVAGPFVFPATNTVTWELKPEEIGTLLLRVTADGQPTTKEVPVTDQWPARGMSVRTDGHSLSGAFVHAGEPPIAQNTHITRIELRRADAIASQPPLHKHWLLVVLLLSMLSGIVTARILHFNF